MIRRPTTRPAVAAPGVRGRAGLSLIEVLIAMAIFLMAMIAIGGLIDFGSDRGMDAAMQAAGSRLCQSKMAEVEAGAIDLTSGGSGQFDYEPEWSWSVEPGSPTVPNVYPITVRVTRNVGARHYEFTLDQLVFDSTQMGTGAEAQSPTASSGTTSGSTTGSGTTSGSTSGGN